MLCPARAQHPAGVAQRGARDHRDDGAADGSHRERVQRGGTIAPAERRGCQHGKADGQEGIRHMQDGDDRRAQRAARVPAGPADGLHDRRRRKHDGWNNALKRRRQHGNGERRRRHDGALGPHHAAHVHARNGVGREHRDDASANDRDEQADQPRGCIEATQCGQRRVQSQRGMKRRVDGTEHQQRDRQAIVACALRAPQDAQERHAARRQERHVRSHGQRHGACPHQHTCRQPQRSQRRELRALRRLQAGPVLTRCEKETDHHRRRKAKHHLVRVPEQWRHGGRTLGRGQDTQQQRRPQRHAQCGKRRGQQVERPEAEREDRSPRVRHAACRVGLADGEQRGLAGHGDFRGSGQRMSSSRSGPNTSRWMRSDGTPLASSAARCACMNGSGPQR